MYARATPAGYQRKRAGPIFPKAENMHGVQIQTLKWINVFSDIFNENLVIATKEKTVNGVGIE